MDPITLRMVERLLIALAGGMSVYLGYRLFLALPVSYSESHGEFEFPKGKAALYRVGPGVFFALFGAGILITGLVREVSITGGQVSGVSAPQKTIPSEGETDLSEPPQAFSGISSEGLAEGREIAFLNCLSTGMHGGAPPTFSPLEVPDLFRRAKAALMLSSWRADWGDQKEFLAWIHGLDQGSEIALTNVQALEFFMEEPIECRQ